MHVWLRDVFDCNGDVEIPGANGFIIRRGDKPPILIHEGDCVDWPKMLVILLRDISRPDVVLSGVSCRCIGSNDGGEAHLHDLFVRHARQEDILLVVVRVEPNHVRNFSVAKAVEALTGLSIPELHLSVITTGQEFATVVREREILNGLYVSMEGP